jgi:hypothetical protein
MDVCVSALAEAVHLNLSFELLCTFVFTHYPTQNRFTLLLEILPIQA